jgi:hypothetical protein
MKRKFKVIGTMLAAIVGIGGAVYGNSKQQPIPYKQMESGNFHRVLNYNEEDCEGDPTTCVYLINDTRNVIPASENPSRTPQGEESYQGAVAG